MLTIKVTDLPVITEPQFTDNDRFLIIDDGKARLLTKAVFQSWLSNNVKGERGEQGVAGRDGAKGRDGVNGRDGANGLSAYQIAVSNGFVGSVPQWLFSLKGAKGEVGAKGFDGWTPIIKTTTIGDRVVLELTDWVGGTGDKPETTGYLSDIGIVDDPNAATDIKGVKGDRGQVGDKGDRGERGQQGLVGAQGIAGDSAYESAVKAGFLGSEYDWVLSLQGSAISNKTGNIIKKEIDGLYAEVPKPEDILDFAAALDNSIIRG